ncbi:metallophosphoesterase family protein [Vulcanisaeta thermophila]|uniref:metallophosphoesterase family protein n=1 Tax=Vulcanisaeta thermophila TaxID=867917 RepID=UPI001EE2F498|nr:metallophosphoesterase [Vulcanisaeta thermophila]
MVKLLVTADIHSPKYLARFRESIKGLGTFDGVLIAGDLMSEGSIEGLKLLINEIRRLSSTVIAVPGNEDYDDVLPRARDLDVIRWLDDEVVRVDFGGVVIRIIGTRGSLEKPTTWQSKHIPGITDIYRRRVSWLRSQLMSHERTILLTHYAPTFKTLEGEDPRVWPMMGVRDLESVIFEHGVIALHGHAHESTVRCVRSGSSYIINAAFPNLWRPIIMELSGDGVVSVNLECREVMYGRGSGKSILDFLGG